MNWPIVRQFFIPVAILLLGITFSQSAWSGDWTLGAYLRHEKRPYKNYTNHIEYWPHITYESDRFYIDDDNAGIYIVKNKTHELDVNISLTETEFLTKHADKSMRMLKDRKMTAMAGLNYKYKTNLGNLYTSVTADVMDRNNGFSADAGYEAAMQFGRFSMAISTGINWYSSNYNNYYYGIDNEEAQRSTLSSYSPGSSVSPYATITAAYSLTKEWKIFAYGRYDKLASAVKNSPMTDRSSDIVLTSGFMYAF